jgi:hypothetical protein
MGRLSFGGEGKEENMAFTPMERINIALAGIDFRYAGTRWYPGGVNDEGFVLGVSPHPLALKGKFGAGKQPEKELEALLPRIADWLEELDARCEGQGRKIARLELLLEDVFRHLVRDDYSKARRKLRKAGYGGDDQG